MNLSQTFVGTTTWQDRLSQYHGHKYTLNIKTLGIPWNYNYGNLLSTLKLAFGHIGSGTCDFFTLKSDTGSYTYSRFIKPYSITVRLTMLTTTSNVIPEGKLKPQCIHLSPIRIANDDGTLLSVDEIKSNITYLISNTQEKSGTTYYIITAANIIVGGTFVYDVI